MFIKYKGNTGSLLKDLCLELRLPVDLKKSEHILKAFFTMALNHLDEEKSIQLIISLPSFLKPFCTTRKEKAETELRLTASSEGCFDLFVKSKISSTITGIFKTLEKYVPAEKLATIYSCFPEEIFKNTLQVNKKAFSKILKAA